MDRDQSEKKIFAYFAWISYFRNRTSVQQNGNTYIHRKNGHGRIPVSVCEAALAPAHQPNYVKTRQQPKPRNVKNSPTFQTNKLLLHILLNIA